MKKAISLILSIALVLTLFTAIPVNAAAVDEAAEFKTTASDFVCGPYDRGEWGSFLNVSTVETGTHMVFTPQTAGHQISMAYGTKVDLNGVHFKLTLDENTSSRYTGIWINNSTANDPGSKGIFIKSTNNGERQFQIGVNGFGDPNAINHSGYEYCYPGRDDRLLLPETLTSDNINEYEYRFVKNTDGSFTLTFNGYDIAIPASVIASAGIDTENVYIHFNSYAQTVSYTVNYVHGGNENCAALAQDINAAAATATAKEKVDLYTNAQALSAEGKANIAQYPNLVSTAYSMTDEEYYKPAESQFLPNLGAWGWTSLVSRTNTDAGVSVKYLQALGTDFQNWINKKFAIDGLNFAYTLDSTDYHGRIMYIFLKNSSDNTSNQLTFKVDTSGGQFSIIVNGKAIDHSSYSNCYPGLNDRLSVADVINGNTNYYEYDFSVNYDGSVTVKINDTNICVISAADVQASGLNLDGAYITFAPGGGALEYTLHYLRSGDAATFADVTDNRYYKVTASDIKDYGWGNITKTETDEGLNIKYLTNYPYIYTQWVDKAVNVDGLQFAYTLNSSSYYSRIINVGLASSTATNPDRASTPLDIQLESGWIRVWVAGTAITEADYSYSAFDAANKIIPCGDIVNVTVNRYEFNFNFEDNGGLSIYINGTKMVTLSAAQVASTGLDFGNARVKFAPAEGFPGDQSEFIDYTIHYIKSGDRVNQVRFDKPVKVYGDANADNVVNILDYIRIKKHISDANFPIFTQAANLAVNEDASIVIGAEDLIAEKQILLFQ